jgi:hypothetical protein
MRNSKPYLLSAATCLLIPFALSSCFLVGEKEREPNDTALTAQSIGSGKTLKGAIQQTGDVDYYRIPWKKGNGDMIASIDLREDGPFDLLIKIHEGGKVVKVVNDTRGMGERIVNALFGSEGLADGTAVFSVEQVAAADVGGRGTPLQYELRVKAREREPNEEGEPNDKLVQASRVDPHRTVKGFFNPAYNPLNDTGQEEDWYAFRIDEQDNQIVNISHSAVPDVDSILSVYDGLGYLVREANSRGKGIPEKLTNILLNDGDYYIRIASAEPGQQNSEVGYLLRIEGAGSGPREAEPNDKYPFANPLSFSVEVEGNINPAGDEDWYRLDVYDPEPQVVTVRVSPTADLDPVIDFFDSSENLILHVDSRGRDEGEIMRNMGVKQGVYYVRVSDKDRTTDNPDNTYTIVAEKKTWTEEEEFEPNNSIASAQAFTLGKLKRGFMSPKGDLDFYTFQIDKSARITVEVSPCALIDFAVNVYDQNGQLVQSINDNPVEEGERKTVALPAGTYYVEVLSVNESENSRDPYILKITKG